MISVKVTGGSKWKDVLKKIADQKLSVKVGVLGGRYSGRYGTNPDTYIAQVAAALEFGTSKMAARKPFRTSISLKQTSWLNLFRRLMTGHPDRVKNALSILGEKMAKDIQVVIKDNLLQPPDKESTVKEKERMGLQPSNVTGLRTGEFMSSIASEVVKI